MTSESGDPMGLGEAWTFVRFSVCEVILPTISIPVVGVLQPVPWLGHVT